MTTDISFVFLCCEVRFAGELLWFSVQLHCVEIFSNNKDIGNRMIGVKFFALKIMSVKSLSSKDDNRLNKNTQVGAESACCSSNRA
jgi:hypothetical protein